MTVHSTCSKAGQVSASGHARGKVILLGEHAVVYGVPALVMGIERGASAQVEAAERDQIRINSAPIEGSSKLYEALSQVREVFSIQPVRLDLELELPPGSGLGASAALGAATARALSELAQKADELSIFRAAIAWERIFHGNPSGVDTAAALRGGVLRFVRGEEPISIVIGAPLEVSICIAGPPASTQSMVESVARLRKNRPESFERNLVAIRTLVESATSALRLGDLENLGRLMDLNHMLLSSWMLSTEELEKARELARDAGAFGSKLTGSGGGGAVIAVGPSGPILRAWQAQGLKCFSAHVRT